MAKSSTIAYYEIANLKNTIKNRIMENSIDSNHNKAVRNYWTDL
jgi:hypothetical protein